MKYERPIINISMFDSETVSAYETNPAMGSVVTTDNVAAATVAAKNVLNGKNTAKALVIIEFNQ